MSRKVIPTSPTAAITMEEAYLQPPPATIMAKSAVVVPVDRFAMIRHEQEGANTRNLGLSRDNSKQNVINKSNAAVHVYGSSCSSASQNLQERKEQELRRRAEVARMEVEDYTFTQEGVDRMKRQEARLLMQDEEKRMRKTMAAEALVTYQATEKERKRVEAEERQRFLDQQRVAMEEQRKREEAAVDMKRLEREARLKQMKADAYRQLQAEFQVRHFSIGNLFSGYNTARSLTNAICWSLKKVHAVKNPSIFFCSWRKKKNAYTYKITR